MTDLVDKHGWKKTTLDAYEKGKNGVDGNNLAEGIPNFIKAPCEKVFEGGNNTWIVLGRDRPGAEDTGYGGKGATHCGMISIVAGREGQEASQLDKNGKEKYVDPNHRSDSAFIYISQKTDIDDNLKIDSNKKIGVPKIEAKSGIGIKADNIRILARQGIKLTTGGDKKLSTGAASIATYGIDLVAGNNTDDLQPMVKGDNLIEYLKKMKDEVRKLNGILTGFLNYQLDFNWATMFHYHITTIPKMPTTPTWLTPSDPLAATGWGSIGRMYARTLPSLASQKYNLKKIEAEFLIEGDAKDGHTHYINSKYNNVN